MSATALDKIDRALLAALQEDGSLTSDKLSERVGLSASAIHRRVRRLIRAFPELRDCQVEVDAGDVVRLEPPQQRLGPERARDYPP